MTEPTNRASLGRLLRILATANPDIPDIGTASKRRVVEYIDLAEAVIEDQGAMLYADAAEMANRSRIIDDLRAENATLRQALEKTT